MPVILKTYTCSKCGKEFQEMASGVPMTPHEADMLLNPICPQCKNPKNKPKTQFFKRNK